MSKYLLNKIGNTPCIELKRFPKIYAKLEMFNLFESIKSRPALSMIEDVERRGLIRGNTKFITASSGNFGTAIAGIGAIKGVKTIVTIPKKMSKVKVEILERLGAEVIVTENVAHDDPESNMEIAKKLSEEIDGSIYFDQFTNVINPQTHYKYTGREIIYNMKKIDCAVITVGSGGTISGISAYLKQKLPNIKIVGVEPVGSTLGNITNIIKPYKLEGIGYNFQPEVLDHKYIDEWIQVEDEEAFYYQERLAKEEGLLVGGSSGAALSGCIKIQERNPEYKRILTIFPDSSKNY